MDVYIGTICTYLHVDMDYVDKILNPTARSFSVLMLNKREDFHPGGLGTRDTRYSARSSINSDECYLRAIDVFGPAEWPMSSPMNRPSICRDRNDSAGTAVKHRRVP